MDEMFPKVTQNVSQETINCGQDVLSGRPAPPVRSGYLGRRVSTAKRALGGVSGPGRKMSVCSRLKEEMDTLQGAGR